MGCSFAYPVSANEHFKSKCPMCDGRTSFFTHTAPTTNWEGRVRERLAELKKQKAEEPLSWGPHPDDDDIPVIYDNSTDTIHVTDYYLRRFKYFPEVDDIVKIRGKFYELNYMEPNGRVWWITEVTVEDEMKDLNKEPVTDFESPGDEALFVTVELEDDESEG